MTAAGRLTTHVLDTSNGTPAANMGVSLFRITSSDREFLTTVRTNGDGRCDSPLLSGPKMAEGCYELLFNYGEYLQRTSALGEALFLEEIPVRFQITDTSRHYHVPLLVAPFGYSTYRGS
ncbi:hydroxyisourate hydrolase [Afipia felis]|uniref:5-hydroxyisourate hydrolase n=2 Tax=Afipia felis TaxID=1035 RepID=A0A380W6X8_AFIFE|nr:hydroxyisourate hydrolase [Afipia felis]EKS31104.1 hydroxyisourate hydrolase [Afipia felis ATCC 53690]SUU75848.1 5-hydroxyisourate hydrolase [Afipia felis]SUU83915.1 5-hydroxyisourate hydrolase [Afipia felis]